MRLSHCIVFGVIILMSFLSCRNRDADAASSSTQKNPTLKAGEYLSSDYIEALKKTCSPLAAGISGEVNEIIVQTDDSKVFLEPILNFHEGGIQFELSKDGSVRAVDQGNDKADAAVVDGHTVRLRFGSNKPTTYVWVDHATDYIAKIALVGKYKDKRGRNYEFREDGWAQFPDRRFRFEIGVDHVLDGFDYLIDKSDGNKIIALEIHHDVVDLFVTAGEGGVEHIVRSRPLYSLRRLKS